MFTATLADVAEKRTGDPRVVRREYRLSIRINPDVPVGKIVGTIHFMSEDKEVSQLRFFGERMPAVVVAPRYISAFIHPSGDVLPEWKAILSAPKGFHLETSVEMPEELHGWLEAEQVSSIRWNFRLTQRPSKEIRSRLVFRTNHPESLEVPVDVLISFRAGAGAPEPSAASDRSGGDGPRPSDTRADAEN
jgi:hypothetical protein